MKIDKRILGVAGAGLLAFAMMTGCKSAEDKALEQAKSQAASTNTAQQIQYVDGNGDTVTTTVQPPAPGQPQQIATTTTPPAPGPKPAKTNPVITPLGTAPGQAMTAAPADGGAMTGPTDGGAMTGPAMTGSAPPPANGTAPVMNVRVPAGTSLAIRINQYINVKHAHAGDRFTGEVAESIVVNGSEVIPRGTHVGGVIDAAHRRGHFKGASILELRLVSMRLNGNEYGLDTHDNVHAKRGKGRRTAGWIGGMTGAGMLIRRHRNRRRRSRNRRCSRRRCRHTDRRHNRQSRHRNSGGIDSALPSGRRSRPTELAHLQRSTTKASPLSVRPLSCSHDLAEWWTVRPGKKLVLAIVADGFGFFHVHVNGVGFFQLAFEGLLTTCAVYGFSGHKRLLAEMNFDEATIRRDRSAGEVNSTG